MVASKRFSDEDRAAIAAAVAEAERRTAAEIVPVIATASDDYEGAEGVIGMWLAILAVAAAWLGLQEVRPASGDWVSGHEVALGLVPLLVILVGAWIVGAILAARIPFLKRLGAGGAMRGRVEEAAERAFDRLHVRKTKAATGVVLYVSLLEHMVCVEADQAVAEKIQPAEWKSICNGMIASIRAAKHREAFVDAIRRCGDLLAQHFPVQPGDVNELTNELRIID